MAILKGFEAAIVVEGTDLREYAAEGQGQPNSRAFQYVEAVADSSFGIRYNFPRSFETKKRIAGLCVKLYLDGAQRFTGVYSDTKYQLYVQHNERSVHQGRRFEDGKCIREDLKFSKTVIDEEKAIPQEEVQDIRAKVSALGSIRLDIFRLSQVSRRPNQAAALHKARRPSTASDEAIPKKAVVSLDTSIRTCLGPPQTGTIPEFWQYTRIDSDNKPYVRFEFKCLPRESLQSYGLIPRDPSPTPSANTSVDEMSREALMEEVNRHRQANAVRMDVIKEEIKAKRGIKREYELVDDEDVSFSHSQKARRCISNGDRINLTGIDLTGD